MLRDRSELEGPPQASSGPEVLWVGVRGAQDSQLREIRRRSEQDTLVYLKPVVHVVNKPASS